MAVRAESAEFPVQLRRSDGRTGAWEVRLGMDTEDRGAGPSLEIMAIGSSGPFWAWNQKHRHLEIRLGYRIAEVNGVRGDVDLMAAQFNDDQVDVLDMVIRNEPQGLIGITAAFQSLNWALQDMVAASG
mmetsp:Transcript_96139/g.310423  ORF Transcript_96139/g.310423 Transcript_96139/m.310423 type:complete len:129 (+) Transcript_96139:105-491(+)